MAIKNNNVNVQSNKTIFEIEKKENTPEMLAFAQGKPTNNFQFADEFNTMTETAIQNTIDNLQLDLMWGNLNGNYQENSQDITGVNYNGLLYKLGVFIKNKDLFASGGNITLLIDRYRPKRYLNIMGERKQSGYKHMVEKGRTLELEEPDFRKSKIQLFNKNSMIYFGQEHFFKWHTIKKKIVARGIGLKRSSKNGFSASVHLQFRIGFELNGTTYVSRPLQRLTMTCTIDQFVGRSYTIISYKRP